MSVDAANGRAWIGGTIIANNSTNPGWMGAVHQPGADIWFRVADYGAGSNAPQADRSTFVGFEGSAGIITSDEYCTTQPWPAAMPAPIRSPRGISRFAGERYGAAARAHVAPARRANPDGNSPPAANVQV